jgi:hypothetical protein
MASMSGKEVPGVAWKKEDLFDGASVDPKTLTFTAVAGRQDY